jgi:hypothetical protein
VSLLQKIEALEEYALINSGHQRWCDIDGYLLQTRFDNHEGDWFEGTIKGVRVTFKTVPKKYRVEFEGTVDGVSVSSSMAESLYYKYRQYAEQSYFMAKQVEQALLASSEFSAAMQDLLQQEEVERREAAEEAAKWARHWEAEAEKEQVLQSKLKQLL